MVVIFLGRLLPACLMTTLPKGTVPTVEKFGSTGLRHSMQVSCIGIRHPSVCANTHASLEKILVIGDSLSRLAADERSIHWGSSRGL
jgi:hypothetical protein